MRDAMNWLEEMQKFWEQRLGALADFVESEGKTRPDNNSSSKEAIDMTTVTTAEPDRSIVPSMPPWKLFTRHGPSLRNSCAGLGRAMK